jgi:hypothetical protein
MLFLEPATNCGKPKDGATTSDTGSARPEWASRVPRTDGQPPRLASANCRGIPVSNRGIRPIDRRSRRSMYRWTRQGCPLDRGIKNAVALQDCPRRNQCHEAGTDDPTETPPLSSTSAARGALGCCGRCHYRRVGDNPPVVVREVADAILLVSSVIDVCAQSQPSHTPSQFVRTEHRPR